MLRHWLHLSIVSRMSAIMPCKGTHLRCCKSVSKQNLSQRIDRQESLRPLWTAMKTKSQSCGKPRATHLFLKQILSVAQSFQSVLPLFKFCKKDNANQFQKSFTATSGSCEIRQRKSRTEVFAGRREVFDEILERLDHLREADALPQPARATLRLQRLQSPASTHRGGDAHQVSTIERDFLHHRREIRIFSSISISKQICTSGVGFA